MYAGETFSIEAGGFTFRVKIEADDSMGAPWEAHDGHGVVSGWTTRDKRAGEVVLNTDRRSRRYYDWQASMKIARRDGWGLNDKSLAALVTRRGRAPTRGDITAEAVRLDYEHLRGWCTDRWQWVGVVVELLDEGEPDGCVCDSLWGIESEADEYLRETAHGMAGGLALGLQREAREAFYWNARDMVTV